MREKKTKKIIQKIAYYDAEGKRRGKTFTASSTAEMAVKIAEWKSTCLIEKKPFMAVQDAVARYIDLKAATLSPSTVASYKDILRVHIKDTSIADLDAEKLSDSDVQLWVSDLAREGLSVKTIKNCYSLLRAAEKMFFKKNFDVTTGQQTQPDLYCPSNDDIKKLLEWIRAHKRYDLERAVLLAAFGPMRRGEICALTDQDINGTVITVNKAVVRNENGGWELKAPKTLSSYRSLDMPGFVIDKLKGIDGKLIAYTPHSLGEAFREAVREAGLPHFRFHDLRHYAASIMNYNGISDKTIQARGGWATPHVMKRIYQNKIDKETQRETDKINRYFSENFEEV